ncbi:nucleotide sugar dehydrogenase [Salisediminibacterium beveridgei]|uniref:UDP-N-acetyl-D-mannosamine dehydrogenase n=1 Tax=Salisediminibacterium beveridgei TaxID=632773 RepID=A0A1D7QRQ5_9BACI|nr:nucleotide sugar dehydrogenase [Salisediminibacterium beveridgei]AOM81685.1 UDP-N-acetyl-D-mannosamine dehydrogenase [Salisediminibacterium beveridgei]
MKITTVGLGYIGLPTSIMFARFGVDVLGVDVNQDIIESLENGRIHIQEPGLQDALEEVLEKKTFRVSSKPETSDVFIIAVPTPNQDDLHKSCDLSMVISAVKSVIPYLQKGNTVIVESTIAPRSMDDYVKPLVEQAGFTPGEDIYLVHCPERVLPGKIMDELIYNNRIVGGLTTACTEHGAKVYETFVKGEIIKTDARTAEMSKLMENTFRDVNIALANELAKICHHLHINVLDVIEMANKHPRVNLHQPGPGVGGHCLAVDPYFIIAEAPEQARLIKEARDINSSMPAYVLDAVKRMLSGDQGQKVTVLGLTYKGNVDDIRESPAMDIYHMLLAEPGIEVVAHDPHVKQSWVEKDLVKSLTGASLALVLTDHDEYKNLQEKDFTAMKHKNVFDVRNVVSLPEGDVNVMNFGNLSFTEKVKH